MVYLSGKQPHGTGDGTAVTERESRAVLFQKRAAERARLAPFLPPLAPPTMPPAMGPMGGFPMGGFPMGGNPFTNMLIGMGIGGLTSAEQMSREAGQYMEYLRWKDEQRVKALRFLKGMDNE